jgi:hypothetical protein
MATIGDVGSYLYKSYDSTSSNQQDLVDWIANIDPYDTPLTVLLGKTTARSVVHQWQTDSLAAASSTGVVEGLDFAIATLTAPSRVTNQCQIFGKDIGVTETQKAENPAGFGDAYAYQLEKGTREVMRNIEKTLMAAVSQSTGTSAAARQMKTLEDFITSNVFTGASYTGLTGDATHAGVFNANDVNRMLNDIWDDGGKTDLIVMNGAYKRQFSALTTSNTRNVLASDKKVVIGVDVYDSDFGLMPIQLNRWSPVATNTASATANATDVTGRVWFLQRSMIALAWLRPLNHRLMGTRGDSTAGQIRAELTLEVRNEKALGLFEGVNNRSSVT